MNKIIAAAGLIPAIALAACGSGGEEPPAGEANTSYEESAPAPLVQNGDDAAPAPRNTSVGSGPDEQVDRIVDETVNPQGPPTPGATNATIGSNTEATTAPEGSNAGGTTPR